MAENYVALDLEMTGLRVKQDKILEIGAVKVAGNKIIEEFQCLINPHIDVGEIVSSLTGITDAMAKSGIEENRAMEKLVAFCEGLPLVGHNISFDFSFLKQCAVNYNIKYEVSGIDTLKIARKLLPDLPKKTLDYLCWYFEIKRKECHRALEDAKAAHLLYLRLKKEFMNEHPAMFLERPLTFKVKKQCPITEKQKKYLNQLINYHRIDFNDEIDYLTRSEASRITDRIILTYGKMVKQ